MDNDRKQKRPLSRDFTHEGTVVDLNLETSPKKIRLAKDDDHDVENTHNHQESLGSGSTSSGLAPTTPDGITGDLVMQHRPIHSTLPWTPMTDTLENDVQKLIATRLEEYVQPIYIPPHAKASLQAPDADAVPLMAQVKDFLASDKQVFLVMGDSGAGKSTFNRHLEQELLRAYKPGDPIPLFINLPTIDNPQKELISEHLRTNNFYYDDIQHLRENRQFIVICDSYDESQLTINLHSTNLLNRPGQWDTKMIISCRSTYLSQDYKDRFQPQPPSRYLPPTPHLLQEAVMIPFSRDQIKAYVEQFVQETEVHELSDGQAVWNAKEYMSKLESVPRLMELVRNPFMLTVALKALPAILDGITDVHHIRMTRLSLYHFFIVEWIRLGKLRLLSMKLDPGMTEILEGLLEDGFSSTVIEFLKDVATAIFQEQDGNPVVQFSPRKDATTWKYVFFGPQSEFTLLRESSPLTRAGVQYQFIHASLLEYFFSCRIVDTTSNLNFSKSPLMQVNLIENHAVTGFLAEFAQVDSNFKQRLLQFIEQSKVDFQARQAAANAITILVKAGISFEGTDLRGVRIPGAKLGGGKFDWAQLQGADLTGCNLAWTSLRQADISGANMTDVCLGGSRLDFHHILALEEGSNDQHEFKIALRLEIRGARLSGVIYENVVGLHPFNKILLDHRDGKYEWDMETIQTQSFLDQWATFKTFKEYEREVAFKYPE
ncbi:WD_REPEATS_REGION domain-containing protein [Linnemannia gamsii]|uniref:WD_REPEATS_REGION domain-containing protein n=1 Tax=Linnemannia gamsii TaxID=64522 RepID=A0A9P6UMU0_9FUNG|nr:WD_REPEATS_REGION domain-containing protein [Linnemannia gamsii]